MGIFKMKKNKLGQTIMLTYCIGALLLVSACTSDEPEPVDTWGEYVVFEQAVECYTLDSQNREFAGATLIQGAGGESGIVLSSLKTYNWTDEFIDRWRKSKNDKILRDLLWKDMPTPAHSWELDSVSMDASYVGSSGWNSEASTVLVDALSARPKFKQDVYTKIPPTKPEWWPESIVLGKTSTTDYGRVMPDHKAVYYIGGGKAAKDTHDVWGSIAHYEGPAKFVISNAASEITQIAVFTLNIDGIHSGISAMISSDGQWVVATSLNDHKVWVFSLQEAWDAFEEGAQGEDESQLVEGDEGK